MSPATWSTSTKLHSSNSTTRLPPSSAAPTNPSSELLQAAEHSEVPLFFGDRMSHFVKTGSQRILTSGPHQGHASLKECHAENARSASGESGRSIGDGRTGDSRARVRCSTHQSAVLWSLSQRFRDQGWIVSRDSVPVHSRPRGDRDHRRRWP